MKKLFELIIFGHIHKFKDVYRENYIDTSYDSKINSTIIIQKCDKCNEYKEQFVGAWLPELNTKRSLLKQDF